MSKINQYSADLKTNSKADLPKEFEYEINNNLIAQAYHIYRDRSHTGSSRAKTRAEVNITKKKIYKQKGTGGARHGASSAPIFVGGGVTHGPKGVKRILKMPAKMRSRALASAMSLKAKDGQVVFVDGLSSIKKTKEANIIAKKLGQEVKKAFPMLFVLNNEAMETKRAIRNLENVTAIFYKDLNIFVALNHRTVVLESEAKAKVAKATKTTKK